MIPLHEWRQRSNDIELYKGIKPNIGESIWQMTAGNSKQSEIVKVVFKGNLSLEFETL